MGRFKRAVGVVKLKLKLDATRAELSSDLPRLQDSSTTPEQALTRMEEDDDDMYAPEEGTPNGAAVPQVKVEQDGEVDMEENGHEEGEEEEDDEDV